MEPHVEIFRFLDSVSRISLGVSILYSKWGVHSPHLLHEEFSFVFERHFEFFGEIFGRAVLRDMINDKVNEFLFLDTERFNNFLGSKWPDLVFQNRLQVSTSLQSSAKGGNGGKYIIQSIP
jgi:hypothetical protein